MIYNWLKFGHWNADVELVLPKVSLNDALNSAMSSPMHTWEVKCDQHRPVGEYATFTVRATMWQRTPPRRHQSYRYSQLRNIIQVIRPIYNRTRAHRSYTHKCTFKCAPSAQRLHARVTTERIHRTSPVVGGPMLGTTSYHWNNYDLSVRENTWTLQYEYKVLLMHRKQNSMGLYTLVIMRNAGTYELSKNMARSIARNSKSTQA